MGQRPGYQTTYYLSLFRTESEDPLQVTHGTEAGLADYLLPVSV
jgi:hypothetical protein